MGGVEVGLPHESGVNHAVPCRSVFPVLFGATGLYHAAQGDDCVSASDDSLTIRDGNAILRCKWYEM